MWNRAGQFVREFAGHSSWATTVHFSADGQFVFLGDGDGAITVWDAASGQRLVTLEAHRAAVVDLRLTPDGRYALSGSFDGSTRLWELDWELAIPGAGGDHA
jgi:WD40 repeat protein